MGRTTNCPLCEANFYCRTSTSKDVCPLHTTSSAGSYSRVNCLCDPGYQCTYYKQIQAIVTLNATLWEFQNDIGGVRTAFIAAMASAAGVHSSQVTINEVMTKSRRRNLLALASDGKDVGKERETIQVHASVLGAVHLRDLDKHLERHNPSLHISHRWEQAQTVKAVPIKPAEKLRAIGKPSVARIEKAAPSKLTSSVQQPETLETKKARAVKLVNEKFLEDLLNKY